MTTGILTQKIQETNMAKDSLARLSDEALLLRIADGDEFAYETFCQRYLKWAYRFDLSFLQNRPEAEDAVQEKFMRVWQKAGSYTPLPGSKVTNYLMKIDKNICLDMVRKGYRKREVSVSENQNEHSLNEVDLLDFLDYKHNVDEVSALNPEVDIENKELIAKILEFTETTFNRKQYLVFWGFISGMTYREIAITYNLVHGSVRGYVARSFSAIRQEFIHDRRSHD